MPTVEEKHVDIGERLRLAREAANITQATAASAIDVGRTTLVAMENGQRRIRTNELQKLASLYHTSVNALLRREAIFVDLIPRFRKLSDSTDEATESAARVIADLVRAEVELEDLLGVKRERNYPPERHLLPGDVILQAENDATELRQWLGLGLSPIRDLTTVLEMDLGIRVYIRPLAASISGLFVYDEKVGAYILLNANHPKERRTQTSSHELGHFISGRKMPDVLHTTDLNNSREERYANAFGRAFMTPARSVMQKFQEITAGANNLTRRHIILMAHVFAVSREAMVRRLEELRLTKPGTWDWFQVNGGITNEQVSQVLGDLSLVEMDSANSSLPTTLRLNLLAAEAWRKGLLSESQLVRLLHIDRMELRRILDSAEAEGTEANEMPKLLE